MHLNSVQTVQSQVIWVLVADEDRAQVYIYHKNKRTIPVQKMETHGLAKTPQSFDLIPVPGMTFQAESLSDFEARRDERGSLIAEQYSGPKSCESYEDLCDEIAQNFVTKVASKINHYCKTKAFNNLIIAAPHKILGAFKQQLNPSVLNCVIAGIDKNFTNDKSPALLRHLQKEFAGVHIG